MKSAFNLPIFDHLADVQTLCELALSAEGAGWDAVFVWDHVNLVMPGVASGGPHADPWIALAMMADRTSTIRLGTCVTPIARRRPAKLAREILTLHDLSDGRFIFGAGSGDSASEFDLLGEATALKTRAAMLDEGLAVLQQLFSGEDVNFRGEFYRIEAPAYTRGPVEIPIWLAGTWPNRKPFRRAARFDGVAAMKAGWVDPFTAADVAAMCDYIGQHRSSQRDFNLAVTENTTADPQRDQARAAELMEAGANWWLDGTMTKTESLEQVRARIRRGPPKL